MAEDVDVDVDVLVVDDGDLGDMLSECTLLTLLVLRRRWWW